MWIDNEHTSGDHRRITTPEGKQEMSRPSQAALPFRHSTANSALTGAISKLRSIDDQALSVIF
ncbi:hypothetical protein [Noviherbaspirillum humi]|uniref:hypothetical protein n=1 Tax=Noviherbaspirillum humi TaxID=1688639 RepID=UPI001160D28D|nr:hypothetical protein [Noviherbaspirillum humi]